MKSIALALATSFVSMWATADTKILHSGGALIRSGDKIYSVGTITVHYVEQHKFDRIKAKRGDSYSGFISALDSWEEMESNSYWEAAGNFNTVMGVLPDKMNTIDIRIAKNENNPIFDLHINDTKVVSKIDSRIKNVRIASTGFQSNLNYVYVNFVPHSSTSNNKINIDSITIKSNIRY